MYNFVIFVLYFTIAGLFFVCCLSLNRWSTRLQTYLFFSAVSNLIYDTGCLLELHATNEKEYIAALKMGYLGRVWIGFSLFLFIAELCRFKLPSLVKIGCGLAHLVIFATILTVETCDLYYNYMEFTMDGDFPKLLHTGGPLYYLQTAINLIYLVVGLVVIIRALTGEKIAFIRNRYLMMLLAVISIGVSYIFYFFKLIPLARKFDLMIIGYAIGMIFMLVAIIKYRMLDATAIAKNYVVDELSEAVIVVDIAENIAYFNNTAKELFPALGNREKDAEKGLIDDIRFLVRSGEPVRSNGKIFTPKYSTLTTGGTEVGTIYSFADVSEHYRYMDELKEQKEKADEANRAKSQFLANMSHEIRTPINAVLGFNEMIVNECDAVKSGTDIDAGRFKESVSNINSYAGNIQSAGGSLLTIINDILDFSKIEAGKMDIVNDRYRLGVLLNDVSNLIFIRARDKGLKFELDVDETLPDNLFGDIVRIRQIMTNILSNAVKYTEKGSVSLIVRGTRYTEGSEDMLRLQIEVRDTGIGIKPEDVEILFNKFQRLDMRHNSTVEGTGLGLAISDQLVKLMGGSIGVESEYGAGSTFKIEIPQKVLSSELLGNFKAAFERGIAGPEHEKEQFKAPDAKILVVDDTRTNLMVAKGLLKATEIKIDTAGGGEEALQLTEKETYDLILMDQRMPHMLGTEAMNRIRAQENGLNRTTPVICMTADAIMGAKERYIAEGFTDYLAKPMNAAELQAKILQYLPQEKVVKG